MAAQRAAAQRVAALRAATYVQRVVGVAGAEGGDGAAAGAAGHHGPHPHGGDKSLLQPRPPHQQPSQLASSPRLQVQSGLFSAF